ncbi:glycosyltransferase family 2 protein [Marivirga arenosa]|uniref:Glycosyltransferase family 2 protein n=1 Tax=Marivirga arenosa TaxID=3059076 RepID=A0AA49JAK0_9BACT|nr:glycosyltransferase family 2 protein [Marivirga sp. BKB1-2]WKK82555.2 glycosyltransferase family 2 protein [Marivirga sp. BKB1-2]
MKVSIICALYNEEEYLVKAINSVLTQNYTNWELILVNDGSTDCSSQIIRSYSDPRIKYFYQSNNGVASARNLGLKKMSGDFFCFLDADDELTPNSLSSRLRVFHKDQNIEFVDGIVISIEKEKELYRPRFIGNPFNDLISLSGKTFFGPTWMIRNTGKVYKFKDGLSHGEDLLFYISISNSGKFGFVDEITYKYRQQNQSAMSNLKGLEKGYLDIYNELKINPLVTSDQLITFHRKFKSIMVKCYFANYRFIDALEILFR